MAGGAVALSFLVVELDVLVGVELNQQLGWFITFGPEGARAMLGAIASSMITVAGLTFSITMLTLQLASSQFGPRLLRNFLRDRGIQVVLGTFISTFIYCLLVLRTVRGTEDASFVPHLSVAAGLVFAIASLAVLIFFVHHTAHSIRIESLLASLASETREAVDRLYPAEMGEPEPTGSNASECLPDFNGEGRRIAAGGSGYVQFVDDEALVRLAAEHDLVVRILARPGSFVADSEPILAAVPRDRVTDKIDAALAGTVIVGEERTPRQDLAFTLGRIVEIAQRALSPGINDPTTTCYCIDRLGEALSRLAERKRPSPLRSDEGGRVRVVTDAADPVELTLSLFAAIARYGLNDADVVARLLATLSAVACRMPPAGQQKLERLGAIIRAEALQRALPFDAPVVGG